MFPPPYRFGSGDIVDRNEQRSGQVDIVVEYPFLPSLPSSFGGPRLYLAEGVAAVVEVKSDLRKQWAEVQKASVKLKKLTRSLTGAQNQIGDLTADIPYFVVGYTGWKTLKPLIERIESNPVDGVLVIDSGLYVSNARFGDDDQRKLKLEGVQALWGLIVSIHRALTRVQTTDFGLGPYLR